MDLIEKIDIFKIFVSPCGIRQDKKSLRLLNIWEEGRAETNRNEQHRGWINMTCPHRVGLTHCLIRKGWIESLIQLKKSLFLPLMS